MTFGQIIKKLRHEADMTQEQLAETLSISAQAISRWENDVAMPDISLLPVLANLFEVTTDYLLGVDISQKEEKIQKIINSSREIGGKGYLTEAIEMLRAGLTEYPGSYELMDELAGKLWLCSCSNKAVGNEQNEFRKEVVMLCENILANCTKEGPRQGAVQLLCYVYPMFGEFEKAEKLADNMPNIYLTNTALLTHIYKGDKLYKSKRDHITLLISSAIGTLLRLNTTMDNGKAALNEEESIKVIEKALALIDILCEDGDYGEYALNRCEAYTDLFKIKQKSGMSDAIQELEKAAQIATDFDSSYNERKTHTSILLRGDEYDGFSFSQTENESLCLLNMLKDKGYLTEIESTERGLKIIQNLEKYASHR